MFSKTVIAAVFAAVVAAQQNPTFAPSSGEVVPACKPYTLKWNAVSAGNVDIVIISGATQGGQQVVGTVASGIANTGSFTYTFPASLGANAFSGYQIYKSGTTEFTYSEPFKVDAASCEEEKPTTTPEASAAPSATKEAYPTESSMTIATSTPAASETPVVPVSSSSICTTTSTVYVSAPAPSGTAPAGSASAPAGSPVPYPSAPAGSAAPYPTAPAGTAAPPAGTGAPLPSGTGAVPYPSAPPEFTGAASAVKAGLGLAGAAAALILML